MLSPKEEVCGGLAAQTSAHVQTSGRFVWQDVQGLGAAGRCMHANRPLQLHAALHDVRSVLQSKWSSASAPLGDRL